MFGVYLNEKRELVIEVAVPGRGGEDLEVRVNEDESVQIVMPPKAITPGSMLSLSIDAPITGLNDHWKVNEMRVSCGNGLLKMAFPPKPATIAMIQTDAAHQQPVPKIDPSAIFKNRFGGRC